MTKFAESYLVRWFYLLCLSDLEAEHCTDIAEVMGSNPRSGLNFFQALIHNLIK